MTAKTKHSVGYAFKVYYIVTNGDVDGKKILDTGKLTN